jgi:hypothetical protein
VANTRSDSARHPAGGVDVATAISTINRERVPAG